MTVYLIVYTDNNSIKVEVIIIEKKRLEIFLFIYIKEGSNIFHVCGVTVQYRHIEEFDTDWKHIALTQLFV
jgi:5-keto 4-deoxyuronate isomerase